MSPLDKLELKVPPVVLWLAFALLMRLSAGLAPQPALAGLHQPQLGVALLLAGVGVAISGVVAFRQARTTVDPRHPQKMSALVTSGVYRATRNPMYLGMLLALVGWACWLGRFPPFFLPPFFVIFLNRFQIAPEERALARMFGPGFAAYRARVRRWI